MLTVIFRVTIPSGQKSLWREETAAA